MSQIESQPPVKKQRDPVMITLYAAIGIIVVVAASFVGWVQWQSYSNAKASREAEENTAKIRQQGVELEARQAEFRQKFERVRELSLKDDLTPAELDEADRLNKELETEYGDLGIKLRRAP